ncbi:MAG: type II toxin-antitoxin system Phd/YefM family antitoxin [Acidimicrobiales bacterium]
MPALTGAQLNRTTCQVGNPSQPWRNTVSEVLRRVEGGEKLTVTVDRRPVAEIVPLRRHRTGSAVDALAIASRHVADRGLLGEVRDLLSDTTDHV